MRLWLLPTLLTTLACGEGRPTMAPPAPEPATYETRCGVAGPTPLLELAPSEYPFRVDPTPDGPRVLVGVFRAAGPLGLFSDTSNRAIVSVGECGEDPVVVGEQMELVEGYRGLALACATDGSALFRIDLSGVRDPVRLLAGTCAVRRTDAGLVAVLSADGSIGRLVILRDIASPTPVIETLVDNVVVPANVFFGGNDFRSTPLWAKGSEAMTLTVTGDILAVDLAPRLGPAAPETTVLVQGALSFLAAADGRAFVWQRAEPSEATDDAPLGMIFAHERAGSTNVPLLRSHLAWTTSPFQRAWVVLRDDSVLGRRVFDREGIELPLPGDTALRAVLADDSFWLARADGERTEELLWEPGLAPRVIIDHVQGQASKSGDGIKVFVGDGSDSLEGVLLYGAFSGGVEQLSARVNFYHRVLADGRILSIVDEDNNEHGQLRLEDPADGSVVEVDPYGYLHSPSLNAGRLFGGDIVYSSRDPEGPRHALYRASVLGPPRARQSAG